MSNLAQRRGAKAARRNKIVKAKRLETLAEKRAMSRSADVLRLPDDSPFKASAALLDVAEILANEDDDAQTLHKKLLVTMVAWNASLLPPDQRKADADEFLGRWFTALEQDKELQFDRDEVHKLFEETIETLMARKLELYPYDRRRLVKVDIEEGRSGHRVTVKSEIELPA